MTAPARQLVDALVDGPSMITGFEWHEEIDSTMRRAAELGDAGSPEGYAVLADAQTAGRGRRERSWAAPAGTSLLCSLLLRPQVESRSLPLLPLLAGLALAEAVGPHVPGVEVGLKWPNDVLAGGRKVAGILLEASPAGTVVLGIGLNVDWRGRERPAELAGATSLAEAAGGVPIDRWRVFAGLVGVLGNRYQAWNRAPGDFLGAYRERCDTIGRRVRVFLPGHAGPLEGTAEGVSGTGALLVRDMAGSRHELLAGDVEHVRPCG